MRNKTLFVCRFIFPAVKTENPFPRSFFCSETRRKRLLRRLCRSPRVSVQRAPTVYSQFPKTSKVRVIGNLTDRLFSDLHGYCLLEQKALFISCWNCALIL